MGESMIEQAGDLRGRPLVGADGGKLGTISDVYVDEQTGRPEWALVTTGLFGTRASFVPLGAALLEDDEVVVPFDKATVKGAPHMEPDSELSQAEEDELYRYYGMEYEQAGPETGLPPDLSVAGTGGALPAAAGAGIADATASGADDAMTRSEEELVVTKQPVRTRARLRKYIVTEYVTKTVPVQREEVRLEHEPIPEGEDAGPYDDAVTAEAGRAAQPLLSGEEPAITLYEEQVVIEKRVVPRERVRLTKDTVTEEQEVGAELRKERIDVEADPGVAHDDLA